MNKDFIKHDEEIYVIAKCSGISWEDMLFNSIPSIRFFRNTYYPLNDCISWHIKVMNETGSPRQKVKSENILRDLMHAIKSIKAQIINGTYDLDGSDSQ
jgi:hypothetical protein